MKLRFIKFVFGAIGILALFSLAVAQSVGSDHLLTQLRSQDPQTRVRAADALARKGVIENMSAALPFVVDATRDEIKSVRHMALNMLWIEASSSLEGAKLVAGAMPSIIERFRDRDRKIRSDAISVVSIIGEHNPSYAIAAVMPLIHDQDPHIRELAITALGGLGAERPQIKALLLQRLKLDTAPEARGAAAQYLQHYNDVTVVSALIAALADPDPYVRAKAAYSLAFIGPKASEALPRLEAMAREPSRNMQLKEALHAALKSIRGR